jgi:UDP-glucuronate 4-epimerase
MRALVTGCAGFIGSHLTESLLEDGHDVVGVDCFNENYGRRQKLRNLERARQWDHFDFVPIDLSRGDLAELTADCDVVYHLAAEPGVRASWGKRFEAYVRNNVMATQLLLDAATTEPGKRVVYASSSSVYGEAEALPTAESTLPRPFSPYGVTKLSAEHLCEAYRDNWGLEVVMLRYFSVFGPRQRPDMAFHRFCRAAIDGGKIEVYGDGAQTRDFTFVKDIVAATRLASEADAAPGRTYNVGGGLRASVNDALAIIGALAERPLNVDYQEAQAGDVRETGADTTRARDELGFDPRTSLQDGLGAEFEWCVREFT